MWCEAEREREVVEKDEEKGHYGGNPPPEISSFITHPVVGLLRVHNLLTLPASFSIDGFDIDVNVVTLPTRHSTYV